MVQGVPRQALLKPDHAVHRLQNQRFALGDRVVMVQNTGGVPLAVKGVVIGLAPTLLDVVWDVPTINGTTLHGRSVLLTFRLSRRLTFISKRCTEYRGSSVAFNTVLNLADPQFVQSTSNKPRPGPDPPSSRFAPQTGPLPAVRPRGGAAPQAGFRPAGAPVRIMSNPARGRGWGPRADDRSAARVLADPVPEPDELHQRAIRDTFNIRGGGGGMARGRGGIGHHMAPQQPPRILQAAARGRHVSAPSHSGHQVELDGELEPPVAHTPHTNGHSDRGSYRAGRGGARGRGRGRGRGSVAPAVQS